MRHSNYILSLYCVILLFLSSCVYVANTPGPAGRNGEAYFGIDYEIQSPHSYWDDNPAIPNNPVLGHYYLTLPGLYNFEYFINQYEYWYGTYEIWINPGGLGGPYGEPGIDGLDNYLMLICDPLGSHEHRATFKTTESASESVVIENQEPGHYYKIMMKKTTIYDREPIGDFP